MDSRFISNEQYHKTVALGSSGIKTLLNRSPRHFWSEWIDPNRVRKPPTAAMQLGTVVHTAILEPHKLDETVAIIPSDAPDKRTKEGKGWWQAWGTANAGKIAVSEEDFARVLNIRDKVREHPVAGGLIAECEYEASFFWYDKISSALPSIPCKARPDALKLNRREGIIDVKTCEDASPQGFQRAIAQYGYAIQAAWYTDAIAKHCGVQPPFIWLAVETQPPHGIGIYLCDRPTYLWGAAQCDRARTLYAASMCREDWMEAKAWPSYPEDVTPINLPRWALRSDAAPAAGF